MPFAHLNVLLGIVRTYVPALFKASPSWIASARGKLPTYPESLSEECMPVRNPDRRTRPALVRTAIAHRGLNRQAPENTIPAFRLAAEAGVRWVETDVDVISDGTPILIHDSTLDRTTDRSGSIYDLTEPDLRHVDAGVWFDESYRGVRIPHLRELVELLNDHEVNLNLELKPNERGAASSLQLVESVLGCLAALAPEREVIISSFSQPLLMTFHERAPQYPIAVCFETVTLGDDWLSVLELCGASFVHPEDRGLTQSHVQRFTAAGYGVNVWTVNDPARANQLFNWGCSGVFSDWADQMLPAPSNRTEDKQGR